MSCRTVYRRRQELRLTDRPGQSLSDSEPFAVIRQTRTELPTVGQTMICGRLRSMGYRVTRARVWAAIAICDPIHPALRWREMTVPGPNTLWHIGMCISK